MSVSIKKIRLEDTPFYQIDKNGNIGSPPSSIRKKAADSNPPMNSISSVSNRNTLPRKNIASIIASFNNPPPNAIAVIPPKCNFVEPAVVEEEKQTPLPPQVEVVPHVETGKELITTEPSLTSISTPNDEESSTCVTPGSTEQYMKMITTSTTTITHISTTLIPTLEIQTPMSTETQVPSVAPHTPITKPHRPPTVFHPMPPVTAGRKYVNTSIEIPKPEIVKPEVQIRKDEDSLPSVQPSTLQSTPTPESDPAPKPLPDRTLWTKLESIFGKEELSDVTLQFQGPSEPECPTELNCHKVVLALNCDYFRKLFEENKAAKVFKVPTRAAVGHLMIRYIYSGTLKDVPKKKDCEDLCVISEIYELPHLQNMCQNLLDTHPAFQIPEEGTRSRKNSIMRSSSTERKTISMFETPTQREHRKKIALELLQTEISYVNNLKLIYEEFIQPLQESATHSPNPILTAEQILSIFSYWEILMKCHTRLKAAFEERIRDWDNRPQIGDVFLEKTAFIKMYKHYVNNYDKALSTYREQKEKNHKFFDFLVKREPSLGSLGLQSFFILPVQRIPRYVLLLQDLIKHTMKGHDDMKNLETALDSMKELAEYINSNKSQYDEYQRLLQLREKIYNWDDSHTKLAVEGRKLIREGFLMFHQSKLKYHVLLFNDSLLICKSKSKGAKLKLKNFVLLATASIQSGQSLSFQIISPNSTVTLTAQDPQDKELWIKNISDAALQSQNQLLATALSVNRDGGTGKYFQKVQQENNKRKRSELALKILHDEREYFGKLQIIMEGFYLPVKEASGTNYPILMGTEITALFRNIEKIHKQHKEFMENLESRVNAWDETTKLSDIFLTHLGGAFKLYEEFLESHMQALVSMDSYQQHLQHFVTFLVTKEKEFKVSLIHTLEYPLRQLSRYYLQLEELKHCTDVSHPDHEGMKVVVTRLAEELEHQKKQTTDQLSRTTPHGTKKYSTISFASTKNGTGKFGWGSVSSQSQLELKRAGSANKLRS